ncbi:hypothetical protein BDQ17DRAFT_1354214 [Cyathus striatus]|nr:hypothetical protein BDQ17DRAFT_1354214 [Cyathus striatus]
MGQFFDEIPEPIIEWITKQHIFWVASAPLTANGHVNISPKGVEGTFHVASSHRVWYEDLSGTGVETIAHIRENGRITVMFNAFDGPPRIVRLYGRGSVYEFGTPEYDALLPGGERTPGSRAAVVVDIYKVASTCGYSVPYYQFLSHRKQLVDWAAKKEKIDDFGESSPSESSLSINPNGMKAWWDARNTKSLDGLPGLALPYKKNLANGTASQKNHLRGLITRVQRKTSFLHPSSISPNAKNHLASFLLGVLLALLYVRLFSSCP